MPRRRHDDDSPCRPRHVDDMTTTPCIDLATLTTPTSTTHTTSTLTTTTTRPPHGHDHDHPLRRQRHIPTPLSRGQRREEEENNAAMRGAGNPCEDDAGTKRPPR